MTYHRILHNNESNAWGIEPARFDYSQIMKAYAPEFEKLPFVTYYLESTASSKGSYGWVFNLPNSIEELKLVGAIP